MNRPPQLLHSDSEEAAYVGNLRIGLFAAMDDVVPEAAEDLLEVAGPAFKALAEAIDKGDGDPLWRLSNLMGLGRTSPLERLTSVDSQSDVVLLHRDGDIDAEAIADGEEEVEITLPAHWAEKEIVAELHADDGERERRHLSEALHAELVDWAKPYHLHRDPWVLEHVFSVLQVHRVVPPGYPLRLGVNVPLIGGPRHQVPKPRKPHLCEYCPELETRAEYFARVAGQAYRYAGRVETAYDAAGWVTGKHRPSAFRHLLWLVRFQMGESAAVAGEREAAIADIPRLAERRDWLRRRRRAGEAVQLVDLNSAEQKLQKAKGTASARPHGETWRSIAEGDKVHESSVKSATKDLAKLIGLRLRTDST